MTRLREVACQPIMMLLALINKANCYAVSESNIECLMPGNWKSQITHTRTH